MKRRNVYYIKNGDVVLLHNMHDVIDKIKDTEKKIAIDKQMSLFLKEVEYLQLEVLKQLQIKYKTNDSEELAFLFNKINKHKLAKALNDLIKNHHILYTELINYDRNR